jgi:hypothetical protein
MALMFIKESQCCKFKKRTCELKQNESLCGFKLTVQILFYFGCGPVMCISC